AFLRYRRRDGGQFAGIRSQQEVAAGGPAQLAIDLSAAGLLAAIVMAAKRKVAAFRANRYSPGGVDVSDEEAQRIFDLTSGGREFAAQRKRKPQGYFHRCFLSATKLERDSAPQLRQPAGFIAVGPTTQYDTSAIPPRITA